MNTEDLTVEARLTNEIAETRDPKRRAELKAELNALLAKWLENSRLKRENEQLTIKVITGDSL